MKPWLGECRCIPPRVNAEFACAMEDVPETDHREFDEDEVVCLDETSKQQTTETRRRVPDRQGSLPARTSSMNAAASPGSSWCSLHCSAAA